MKPFNCSAMVMAIHDEIAAFGVPQVAFASLPPNEFSALLWLMGRDWQAFKRVLDVIAEREDA